MTKQRSAVAEELRQASKRTIHLTEVQTPKPAANSSLEYGSDPQINPRLAAVIASAKRIGFAKASIENAIARGQGVSPSGAALENVTIEAMVPPSVAVIIECQTDSRLRTLSDVRLAVKEAGGTVTPTNHLFNRKGKIICKNPEGMEEEDIFDRAIEAGAVDIELENDGSVIIYAESNETTAVANAVAKSSSLRVTNTDIIWDPKEDMMVDVTTPEALNNFLGRQTRANGYSRLIIYGQTGSTTIQVSRMCI